MVSEAAEPLRVLTVWQPWASLIAIGAKRIETRGWSTRQRGLLAIAAAAKPLPAAATLGGTDRISLALARGGIRAVHDLPLGKIVAVCDLTDVLQVPENVEARIPHAFTSRFEASDERYFGDFTPGRFGWFLRDVHRLAEPVPARGKQRLWHAPAAVDTAVREQLGGDPDAG